MRKKANKCDKNISNPQKIVDNVDNFLQKMWKYGIFRCQK